MFLKLVTTWIYVAVIRYTVRAALDCEDGYLSLDIKGSCTNSTCLGECRDENTCCLEKCFVGDRPSTEELEGCATDSDLEGSCSNFANQTECLAGKLNKTIDVCLKHTISYISIHPVVSKISSFNPINWFNFTNVRRVARNVRISVKMTCPSSHSPVMNYLDQTSKTRPCETGKTKTEGECHFQQCVNSSYCQLDEDSVWDSFVCCLDKDIFPLESDCENHERLDKSMSKRIDVSTLTECQNICQEGLCRMPDPNRFPACCRQTHRNDKPSDDESLHGSVIAVIVALIVVLLIAAAFGGYYVYRTRQQDNSKKKDSNTSPIEITGVDEMIGGEQAWNEDHVNFDEVKPKTNGFLSSEADAYQVPDEYDHASTPEFDGSAHSIEKLRLRDDKHSFDNCSHGSDNDNFEDVGSRRTGNPAIFTIDTFR